MRPNAAAVVFVRCDPRPRIHHCYGAKARRPVLRVYGDLSVLSDNNPELRKDLTAAKADYGAIGRKAARTRGKKK